MARLTATTNPTNLIQIDRSHVAVEVVLVEGSDHVMVRELNVVPYELPEDAQLTLVARAGNTSSRYNLGTVAAWAQGPHSLAELDRGHLKKFRVLVTHPDSGAKLLASAENIRPKGEGDLESLLPIVSVDLGQRLWRVSIDDDGATLECNSRIFPNGESAQSYAPFRALVLPEALRVVLSRIAEDPECLTTEGSIWREWAAWMPSLGIDPSVPADKEGRSGWVEKSAGAFCDKFAWADDLESFLAAGEGQK